MKCQHCDKKLEEGREVKIYAGDEVTILCEGCDDELNN